MNTLKKMLVSGVTIVSFSFYAYFLQDRDGQATVTTVPAETLPPAKQQTDSTPKSAASQSYRDHLNETTRLAANLPRPAPAAPAQQPVPQPYQAPPPPQPPPPVAQSDRYKNGTYTGSSVDVYYGFVQVQTVIQGGQITDVKFLEYPNDRDTSRSINSQAMPLLVQEAIQAQSAEVSGVSGASATSEGFVRSLSDALSQA